jgi:hypothetical protein
LQVENDEKLREEMRKKLEKELDEEYSEKIEFLKVRSPDISCTIGIERVSHAVVGWKL